MGEAEEEQKEVCSGGVFVMRPGGFWVQVVRRRDGMGMALS